LIGQARMRGLKVYGATISPNEGTTVPNTHTPENEAKRLAYITTNGTSGACKPNMQNALYALRTALNRTGAALRLRSVHSGMHAVADLEGVDAERVFAAAEARNIEVMPLSAYYYGRGERANALVLGFGSCSPAAIRAGMWRLAAAIDVARRSP